MTSRPVRLLVAETRPLHRAALSAALDAVGDLEVVAQAGDGDEVLDRARWAYPDVVWIGASPSREGLGMCERVKDERPDQRVLVVDEAPDRGVLLAAVRAGADGYETQERPVADLADAVRRVHGGGAVIPELMLGDLLRDLVNQDRQADESYERFLRLTSREKQVLELLAEGCGNLAIAEILVISPQTARTHIQNVVRKLGAHSRLEAAAMASEHGWLRRRAPRSPR